MDANNSLFPFAFAVVDAENDENWLWFLQILQDIISKHAPNHLINPSQLILLSDRQKGLIEVVEKLFPASPHGYCLRHLSENMHKSFKHKDLKSLLWKAARAPTVNEFEGAMKEMRELDVKCVEWLYQTTDKAHWAEAYFPGRRYGHLTSNIAESLNSWLLEARELPIFGMMESIRGLLMRWFQERSEKGKQEKGLIVQSIVSSIQICLKNRARQYRPRMSTSTLWEVIFQSTQPTEELRQIYIVDIEKHLCDCHRWQASGIPCAHALAVFLRLRQNPHPYVEECFRSNIY